MTCCQLEDQTKLRGVYMIEVGRVTHYVGIGSNGNIEFHDPYYPFSNNIKQLDTNKCFGGTCRFQCYIQWCCDQPTNVANDLETLAYYISYSVMEPYFAMQGALEVVITKDVNISLYTLTLNCLAVERHCRWHWSAMMKCVLSKWKFELLFGDNMRDVLAHVLNMDSREWRNAVDGIEIGAE
eukprot:1987000-Ditylum_brightwellii.AAC.1